MNCEQSTQTCFVFFVIILCYACVALGETNEAFYRNIYTGQQLPVQQRQPLRPHRPAPVPDFNQLQNRPKNHTNVAGVDVRFISTSTIQQPSL